MTASIISFELLILFATKHCLVVHHRKPDCLVKMIAVLKVKVEMKVKNFIECLTDTFLNYLTCHSQTLYGDASI